MSSGCLLIDYRATFSGPVYNAQHAAILQSEVEKLLQKGAIEPVPPAKWKQVFTQHFRTPKENGKLEANHSLKRMSQVRFYDKTSILRSSKEQCQCNNQGSSYNRPFKCPGRQLKQGKDTSYRMDIQRFSDSKTVSGIEHTIDRPFRVRSKSQGRSILLVDTKSKSMDDRSALSVPRQNMNAYAFPPNRVDSQSASAHEQVRLPAVSQLLSGRGHTGTRIFFRW